METLECFNYTNEHHKFETLEWLETLIVYQIPKWIQCLSIMNDPFPHHVGQNFVTIQDFIPLLASMKPSLQQP